MWWLALAVAFVVPLERPRASFLGLAARRGGRNVTHATEYVGRLTVGGQDFKVLFDTGSDQLLVPSVDCPDESCGSHGRYDAAKSNHSGEAGPPQAVQFGMGSAGGFSRQDQVCVAGHCAEATFLECLEESSNPFLRANFDGVLGLSLKLRRNATNSSSVVEALAKTGALDAPAFAVMLKPTPQIVFGREALVPTEAVAPVSEPGYWQFSLSDLSIGGKKLNLCHESVQVGANVSTFFGKMCCRSVAEFEHEARCQYGDGRSKTATEAVVLHKYDDGRLAVNMSDGCVQKVPAKWVSLPTGCRGDGTLQAALDTGMSLVMGPDVLVKQVLAGLGVSENCTGHSQYPALGLHLPSGESLSLQQEHYMDELAMPDGQYCWPHFMAMPPTGKGPLLVLGLPFFRAYTTVFDAGPQPSVGFAQLPVEKVVRKAKVDLAGWRGAQPA